jgi:hypothetical protein
VKRTKGLAEHEDERMRGMEMTDRMKGILEKETCKK